MPEKQAPRPKEVLSSVEYTVTPPTKNQTEDEVNVAVFKCPQCRRVAAIQSEYCGNVAPISCPYCLASLRVRVKQPQ